MQSFPCEQTEGMCDSPLKDLCFMGTTLQLQDLGMCFEVKTEREAVHCNMLSPSSAICHNNTSVIRSELNTDLIYQIMF